MKPLTKIEFDTLREEAAAVLGTSVRPLVIGGEAILGIEGLARCTAGPGRRFVNLVNGPYGKDFGLWLREGGAEVRDIEVPATQAVQPEAVRQALKEFRPDALSYVYAEAVTGGKHDAEEIQKIAREFGVYTIVDAVSSFGADLFYMDEWGVDFVSMGMQKALLGSNGISFLGISERGMAWLRENRNAPVHSQLSLPELYDEQEKNIPPAVSVLEARDALRAFGKIREMGGCRKLIEKHRKAAEEVRRQVQELGYSLYMEEERFCTNLNTTVMLPDSEPAGNFTGCGIVKPGDWQWKGKLLRINHYGEDCEPETIRAAMKTLEALRG